MKCPRSIDFRVELPRHPTGKLYKRLLKDEYWAKSENQKILISGCELDELEMEESITEETSEPHGNVGAQTPEEIALSIVAEILSVIRKKEPFSLRELNGKIHS